MAPPSIAQAKAAIVAYLTSVSQISYGATVSLATVRGLIDAWIQTYASEIFNEPDYATLILPAMTQLIYKQLIEASINTPFSIPGMSKYIDVLPDIDTLQWLQPTIKATASANTITVPNNGIIYVDQLRGSDLGGTGSADSPYQTLRFALTQVAIGKATIYIAEGNYNEGNLILNAGLRYYIHGISAQSPTGQAFLTLIQGTFTVLDGNDLFIDNVQVNSLIASDPFVIGNGTDMVVGVDITLSNVIYSQGSTANFTITAGYQGHIYFSRVNANAAGNIIQTGNNAPLGTLFLAIFESAISTFTLTDANGGNVLTVVDSQLQAGLTIASYLTVFVNGCRISAGASGHSWDDAANGGGNTVVWLACQFTAIINKSGTTHFALIGCQRIGTGDILTGTRLNGINIDDTTSTKGVVTTSFFPVAQTTLPLVSTGFKNLANNGTTYSCIQTDPTNSLVGGSPTIGLALDAVGASVIIGNVTGPTAMDICWFVGTNGGKQAKVTNGGTYTTLSDIRVKQNIRKKEIDNSRKYLDKLLATNIYSYTFKKDIANKIQIGVIAQEVAKIYGNNCLSEKNRLHSNGEDQIEEENIENHQKKNNDGEDPLLYMDYNSLLCYVIMAFQQHVKVTDKKLENLEIEIRLLRQQQIGEKKMKYK